ncbi:hypothetical protein BpHYR1_000345 [Brachionus plicatilis]|uniref:Uncharacterized protein n=1 Tax=Brachionus plicatilis TaxID=10195 RepID=A0A3M7SCB2_BRAPC|nr:hypothetical protein BpHYR1_000345 [Brachionus plicatilis]
MVRGYNINNNFKISSTISNISHDLARVGVVVIHKKRITRKKYLLVLVKNSLCCLRLERLIFLILIPPNKENY